MDSTDTNYISKVFGQSNFGKPSNEVPLFVEEQFTNLLNYSCPFSTCQKPLQSLLLKLAAVYFLV